MNADLLFSPTFPHGTPDGYRQGCKGSHCPADMSCRDVHRRYVGDYTFARMFDAGVSLTVIVKRTQEAVRAAQDAEKRARRTMSRAKPAKRVDGRIAANQARAERNPTLPRHQLADLLGRGLTDREIGLQLGLTRRYVTDRRNNLGFPRNPDIKGNRTSVDSRLHLVEGLSDEVAAERLGLSAKYIRKRRQIVARRTREALADAGASIIQEGR